MSPCMYVCNQKEKASNLLEQELQTVVSHMGAGNQPQIIHKKYC